MSTPIVFPISVLFWAQNYSFFVSKPTFATHLQQIWCTFAPRKIKTDKKMNILLDILKEVWVLTNEMSPYLLLGFLLAGIMHEFLPSTLYTNHLGKNNFRSVFLSALFGVPLPLCSCGVIPTAMGLRREGASKGATVSFLIATPQTGVDSIIATDSLMGLPFAIIRPIAAFLTAILGGTLVNKVEAPSPLPLWGSAPKQNNQEGKNKTLPQRAIAESEQLVTEGKVGKSGEGAVLYRLPSSSRAYPLSFDKKVEAYGKCLGECLELRV